MAETTPEIVEDAVLDGEDAPSSYTTSTPEVRGGGSEHHGPRRRHRPPQGGHRPRPPRAGHRQWKINGRTLEAYFPNKVHQQLVNEPFRVTELEGRFDVIARIHGGGPPARPARCASAWPAR